MAAVSTIIAAAAVTVAAGSAYASSQAQGKAADAQKEASRIQSNEQQAQADQQRRQQVREERVKRAQIEQSSNNTGVSNSSGELGSLSVLGTQTGTNISNIQRSTATATAISGQQQKAVDANTQAQNYSAIGSFAGSVFGATAGYAAKDLFGNPQVPVNKPQA